MRWLPGQLATPVRSATAPRLNPAWVAKGLVLVVHDGRWITPAGSSAMTAVGSIIRRPGPNGVGRRLGEISLGITNLRYEGFFLRVPPNGRRSVFANVRAISTGASGFGRVFQHKVGLGGDLIASEGLWFNSGRLAWTALATTSDMQGGPTDIFPLGVWASVGFTHDRNVVGSNLLSYLNGTRRTTFYNATPSGSYLNNGTDLAIGNRPSDSARSWDGDIGILAFFEGLLTDADHASLHGNPNQLLDSSPMSLWAPGDSAPITIYRPGSDVIVNGWTATPGGTLASCIDDPTLDRADFITSPNLTDPATLAWGTPLPAGTYDISIDADRTGASGQVRIVLLDAGNAVVGTSAWQALTTTATTYTLSVTTSATAPNFRIEVQ